MTDPDPDPDIAALERVFAACRAGVDPDDPALADDWAAVQARLASISLPPDITAAGRDLAEAADDVLRVLDDEERSDRA